MQTKPNIAFAEFSRLIRRMGNDPRLLSSHVSLCSALFAAWQKSGYANPFGINRKQLMAFSKIASIATYHKCIKELNDLGYIHYRPSFSPRAESVVYWSENEQQQL